jgi:phenylalanyl-tRNA synthetase beta chain
MENRMGDSDKTAEQMAADLTMAGLEVDSVEPAAGDFSKVVVAQIDSLEPHPDADRLQVLSVNAGQDEPLQIVTAAKNVYADLKVPLALVGAELVGGLKIKKSKLRGVLSQGMLCGPSEVGLSEEKDTGILELSADAPIGTPLEEYFELDDVIFDIDLTPNRSDCLSMIGLGRDLSALYNCELVMPAIDTPKVTSQASQDASVEAPKACPRYCLQMVEGVNVDAPTPLWITERLRRAGIASINILVDIGNYVMIEQGQPLHIFDADTLQGSVTVRQAKSGESLDGLDDKTYTLTEDNLVIADQSGPIALAGLIGDAKTGVSDKTANIVIESAFFEPAGIMQSSRDLAIKTQAAYRFERGVDFKGQEKALARAMSLIMEYAGGQVGPLMCYEDAASIPDAVTVTLRYKRIADVLGITIPKDMLEVFLTRLGFVLSANEAGWEVQVPSYRCDIAQEIDLIEEVARLYGYDNIPAQSATMRMQLTAPDAEKNTNQIINSFFQQHGFHECINYAFISEEQHAYVNNQEAAAALTLVNPISSELSIMRSSLWPGLLQAAQENKRFGHADLALYELGMCFTMDAANKRVQVPHCAALLTGAVHKQQWHQAQHQADFYDIKSATSQLGSALGLTFSFESSDHATLHPGAQAAVLCDGQAIGWVGQCHPKLQKACGFKTPIYLLDIQLNALICNKPFEYNGITGLPQVKRDLNFVLDDAINYEIFAQTMQDLAGEKLVSIELFDEFRGKDIPEGQKSWAYRLTFMDLNRTLVDDEINVMIEQVVKGLATQFDAQLRI